LRIISLRVDGDKDRLNLGRKGPKQRLNFGNLVQGCRAQIRASGIAKEHQQPAASEIRGADGAPTGVDELEVDFAPESWRGLLALTTTSAKAQSEGADEETQQEQAPSAHPAAIFSSAQNKSSLPTPRVGRRHRQGPARSMPGSSVSPHRPSRSR